MKDVTFVLLGYDNPLDQYPGAVVPVGRLNGRLVVVYTTMSDGKSHVTDNVAEDIEFTPLTNELRFLLAGFDYLEENLFGLAEDRVVRYRVAEQEAFFLSLLEDPSFAQANPFIRLSLARGTSCGDIICQEVKRCYESLTDTPAFAADWLPKEIVELQSRGIDTAVLESLLL
jgi:hypothetical protein